MKYYIPKKGQNLLYLNIFECPHCQKLVDYDTESLSLSMIISTFLNYCRVCSECHHKINNRWDSKNYRLSDE